MNKLKLILAGLLVVPTVALAVAPAASAEGDFTLGGGVKSAQGTGVDQVSTSFGSRDAAPDCPITIDKVKLTMSYSPLIFRLIIRPSLKLIRASPLTSRVLLTRG